MAYGIKLYDRKTGLPFTKEVNGVLEKICSKCQIYKELNNTNFHINKSCKRGFVSQCKMCSNKQVKTKNYFNDKQELSCRVCKQWKEITEFSKTTGYLRRKNRSTECKSCESIRKKNTRKNTLIVNTDRLLVMLVSGCKSRMPAFNRKGKDCNINIDYNYLKFLYDKQNGLCAISGIPMTSLIKSGKCFYNISVDRIDSSKGYLKENVQLVCAHVNMMKSNLSQEELLFFCNKISDNAKNKN